MLSNISNDWMQIFFAEERKEEANIIFHTIDQLPQNKLCPKPELVFESIRLTPLDDVNVVIIGMDPYPNRKHAHGLSFSSKIMECNGPKSIPASLKNIYNCLLFNELIDSMPTTADLTSWAKQGVLCLNLSLTTEEGKPGAHMNIWRKYMTNVIKTLSDFKAADHQQLIFLLWGNDAQKLESVINQDVHIVLKWIHPSPMAQTRASEHNKFKYCQHFNNVNTFLEMDWKEPINWMPTVSIVESESDSDDENVHILPPYMVNHNSGETDVLTTLKVFTDGSCYPNTTSQVSRAGFSCIFVSGVWKERVIVGNLSINKHFATNIRAEGMAILVILKLLWNSIKLNQWTSCIIYTDSEFWRNMLTSYMPKWSKQKFAESANSDMTEKMWDLWKKINKTDKELDIIHIYGHNKSGWKNSAVPFQKFCYDNNNAADILATWARVNLTPGEVHDIE
jgi:uracil-DNA glycosylase